MKRIHVIIVSEDLNGLTSNVLDFNRFVANTINILLTAISKNNFTCISSSNINMECADFIAKIFEKLAENWVPGILKGLSIGRVDIVYDKLLAKALKLQKFLETSFGYKDENFLNIPENKALVDVISNKTEICTNYISIDDLKNSKELNLKDIVLFIGTISEKFEKNVIEKYKDVSNFFIKACPTDFQNSELATQTNTFGNLSPLEKQEEISAERSAIIEEIIFKLNET